MLRINPSESVFVFDLDDTLYYEVDYVRSGIRFVVEYLDRQLGKAISPNVLDDLLGDVNGKPKNDWLQNVAQAYEIECSIESLLWIYRLHPPKIELEPETHTFVNSILERSPAYILTDGRVITQTLKLNALGLSRVPSLISEQFASEKPDDLRFRLVMEKHPDKATFIYIGDNVKKDFLAPNQLGWTTVGLRTSSRMVHHSESDSGMTTGHYPTVWVSRVGEVMDLIRDFV